MGNNVIIDTGPLFALFNSSDEHHYWAQKKLTTLKEPLITCESVVSETIFLMQRTRVNTSGLFELMDRGDLIVKTIFEHNIQKRIFAFINNYAKVQCSFADAYVVQLYETENNASIFTIDSDFNIYRDSQGSALTLRSEEHTSELQSRFDLVCRLLLEKKKKI